MHNVGEWYTVDVMLSRFGIVFLATVFSAAIAGGFYGRVLSAGPLLSGDTEDLLKAFTGALAIVQQKYVEPVPTEDLVENAIRGMLRTLDPHSSFFTSRAYNRLQEEQRGKYYGLGITIRAESPGSGRVLVMEPPMPETPAYKVGLRAGDIIFKIEGQPIDDWDLNTDVIPNLKGPRGTKVNITVERPGASQLLEFTVVRDEIPLYTIKYALYLQPGLGYIKINKFSETTSKELDQALDKLHEEDLVGLILDLRNNPGGALGQAIAVSDRFLQKSQVIVSTRARSGKMKEYKAPEGSREDYPIIVLINGNSASASEIVAGALQDHDRALIVGETSFGKALVQTIYPLGNNRGLALTTGKYYTPSKRLIQRDFSDSFYDYYYNRSSNQPMGRKESQTDGGRVVFGGGGIAPDEKVGLDSYSKLGSVIDRGNLFSEFTTLLTEGTIQSDTRFRYSQEEISAFSEDDRSRLKEEIDVTDKTLKLFREFLTEKEVEFEEQSFDESRRLIENRLKQELFLTLLGFEEGFKVALKLDAQVQKAIELFPQAAILMKKEIARKESVPLN